MVEISIRPEIITRFGVLPITNSLVSTWLIMGIFFLFFVFAAKRLKAIPSRGQLILETTIEAWLRLCDTIGGLRSNRYFPFITTLFFFILISNWFGLIPGISSLGFFRLEDEGQKFVPFFRAPTADLNTALALALVSFFYIEIEGITTLGLKIHLKKFFVNPIRDSIGFFVGLLELLSEFTRIVSFSFRLFGNVFAGEVLLTIMTFLIPLLIPIPFLGLEIFTGFIQAFVFATLTLVFASMATQSDHNKHLGGELH